MGLFHNFSPTNAQIWAFKGHKQLISILVVIFIKRLQLFYCNHCVLLLNMYICFVHGFILDLFLYMAYDHKY